jgi:hypothetical protein
VLVGVDFDNTIVNYDALFHRLAVERGQAPADLPTTKRRVKAALSPEDWVLLQAAAYGDRIAEATAFPGAVEFFRHARKRGIECAIVSHKTERPLAGPDTDLRAAALGWMRAARIVGELLGEDRVHFGATPAEKVEHVRRLGCTHFVDDHVDFLTEPDFPDGVVRILFDPAVEHARVPAGLQRASSWADVERLVLG